MKTVPEGQLASGLRVWIDRTLCVGFGDCVARAPEGFALDEEGIAVLFDPAKVTDEEVCEAAQVCPVDAIVVLDASGQQLAP